MYAIRSYYATAEAADEADEQRGVGLAMERRCELRVEHAALAHRQVLIDDHRRALAVHDLEQVEQREHEQHEDHLPEQLGTDPESEQRRRGQDVVGGRVITSYSIHYTKLYDALLAGASTHRVFLRALE